MRHRWALTGIGFLLFAACGEDNQAVPTPTPSHTATATATRVPTTARPTNTATATSTQTPVPSPTHTVTDTPAPTATETPKDTPSATPSATVTATATPTGPRPIARRIADESDLIGGPLAYGRVGDWLIANDRIRAVIKDVGRDFSFVLTYGGIIIDADRVRAPGESGRDSFGATAPLINISSTVNVTAIQVMHDGSDGQPARLRASGVDDLFDFFDPTNAVHGLSTALDIPDSAQDKDIPVEITTDYVLGLGEDAIRIETTIKNTGSTTLNLYVGDVVNGSGEMDTFVPSLGFGEGTVRNDVPFLAYTAIGSLRGVSYGIIPEKLNPADAITAGAFTESGLTFLVNGQDVLDVLLLQLPGRFTIPAGGMRTYVRHFAVGDGDVDSVARVQYALTETPVGTVHGRVTAGGEPAENAIVTVVNDFSEGDAEFNVVTSFRTGPDGRYEGQVPIGTQGVMAKLEGYPYDADPGNPRRPRRQDVEVTAGGDTSVPDFTLPDTSTLRVTVVDENNAPIPAKVSIVGFDPAPDPGNLMEVAGGFLRVNGFVFRAPPEQKQSVLFGLTDVRFIGASGDSGPIALPPSSEGYEVFVTRGPEYSAFRQHIMPTAGQSVAVNAQLARVVNTAGFVSTDYHVHLINSPDSIITKDDRILTMAAEGVDYFVASDHDFITDLTPDIARLGLQALTRSVTSAEVTTFNLGHFNAWPLVHDPTDRLGGAPDWSNGNREIAPGADYPSAGSFELSPGELFVHIQSRFDDGPDSGVLQANHFNSNTLGYFYLAGIDTKRVPPQSFTMPSLIRQNPATTNLYDDRYTALELWIEAKRDQTALFYDANLGDWFNLLSQGILKTGTADSDTHSTAIVQAGGPRNFVASSSDNPALLDDRELAANVNAGRSIGTNGPFVRFTIEGDAGQTAGLDLAHGDMVRATGGTATVRLNIQSPTWAPFDTVELYVNTVTGSVPERNFNGAVVPRYTVQPTITLVAGTNFEVRTVPHATVTGAARFEADVTIPLTLARDAWVVAIVRGTDGVSAPLWPMNPQDLCQAPGVPSDACETSNTTLADLLDGNVGEGGNPALAFTNPLFVDVNGNGAYDPPGFAP
jgi:hypothetical protein